MNDDRGQIGSGWMVGAVLAIAAAVVLLAWLPVPAPAVALAAGGAVLLGAWIARRDERRRRDQDLIDQARRLAEASAASHAGAQAGERRAADLRAMFDAVDAPILGTDENGAVVLFNAAGERLLGIRLAGRTIEELFTQPELRRLHADARDGKAGRAEVHLRRPQGLRVFEASAAPVFGGTQAPFRVVMALRDVTELSRAVQVKSDFVANASHELRTPITALRMAVDTLAGGAADDPPMRQKLMATIAGNTARLEEMVRDLLDLSRLEAPEAAAVIEPLPASILPGVLAPDFEQVCRVRRLTLEFDLSPALEGLRTDRALLMLVLRNLIENATRFAYEGTAVRVVGRPAPADAGHGVVRFEVIDQGVGIPIQHQQRVFERYYQVDAARTLTAHGRGSGLGLAIVKHAVRRLGGSVRLSSVWKEGTTVTVDLPGALPETVSA